MIFIIKKNIFFFSQNLQKCPSGVGHSKAVVGVHRTIKII
jgi:hypothetical protein